MNRRLSRFAPLAVAVLSLVPAVALAAGSSSQVWVTSTCTKEQYKPKSIVLACGDGNTLLKKLTWMSWTASAAHGAGSLAVNNCTPSCVGGTFGTYPATVTLSTPKACKNQSHKTFTAVRLSFTATKPSHIPTSYKIFCPV